MASPRSRSAAMLAVGAGVWMLIDVVRVWTPSLITIFGQAAETPPELMGAYALGCAVVAVLLASITRSRPPVWALALALLGLCRIGLQATDGGRPQLLVASLGVAFGLWWLGTVAVRHGDVLVAGVTAGIALSVVTHAGLGTWGAVWRGDPWGWLLLGVQVGLAAGCAQAARGGPAVRASARVACLLMPGLFLAGIVLADAARASVAADWVGLATVALSSVVAVGVSTVAASRTSAWIAAAVLVGSVALGMLATAEVDAISGSLPPWSLPAYLLGMPALAHLWVAASGGARATATTATYGGLIWVALIFGYYAGYDLGYTAPWLVVLAALVLGIVAATGPDADGSTPVTAAGSLVVLASAAAIAVIVALAGPAATVRPLDGVDARADAKSAGDVLPGDVRVAAYNVRMGYGMDGTFRPDLVAADLADTDVALLSEVDRAWLLNGGQDQLAILARLLDRDAVFSPAADPVWGDAVITTLPVAAVERTPLPSYGAVTGAQALSVRVRGTDTDLWMISTHLQPNDDGVDEQAGDLATLAQERIADGIPVVLGGDLNTEPDSAAFAELTDGPLRDALRRSDPPTSPADDPQRRIDHLLATRSLKVRDPQAGTSQASDHLPVYVRVQLRNAG
ncbi:endonuclease/exonuclease/phosphatase family metal-dependent hydrolase [Mumia flava]|uniref:Endonuclease/exonuclease/phosphatase family metal-dependent hydrolase n=1 Tax=Mumia flava TaxID=1348852 RepID=A0A0B2BVS3_9ACTN|nr:endonuclease/exonuclease/phosphatase family protein [Mumia flava]PJJ58052.1 endonuclease/exonuclease/phosphatase family metal-dependent hydrolase [Mumia flava]